MATRLKQWVPGCAIVLAVALACGVPLYIQFHRITEKQDETTCRVSLQMLAAATLKYAQDHDHRLPQASTWWTDVYPRYDFQVEICPKQACDIGYAMSPALSGADIRKVPHPEQTILLYEACGGIPEYRHRGGMNVAYADGHASWIPGPKR